MVCAKERVFKRNDRASEHVLDRADEVAVDADHVAFGRQRQRLALLRRDRAPLQDHASVGGEKDRRRRILRAVGPDELHAEFHDHAPATGWPHAHRSGEGGGDAVCVPQRGLATPTPRVMLWRPAGGYGTLRHPANGDTRPGGAHMSETSVPAPSGFITWLCDGISHVCLVIAALSLLGIVVING